MSGTSTVLVRQTTQKDFAGIIELSKTVYPNSPSWTESQLASHHQIFPDGQFVAVDTDSSRVVGMAASLIISWNDYDITTTWRDFTDRGLFTNHDPEHGHTLYGAEVMVSPGMQGHGIGTQLYAARESLVYTLGLWRIRAGSRLRDYHRYADVMTASEYVAAVINGDIIDRTLIFQLRRGFTVLGVVANYLTHDPASLGYAAVIEWKNDQIIEFTRD